MRFLWYFRLSSYLLIGSGFLALLITDYYGLFSAVIFAAIIAIGWQIDAGKWRPLLSPLAWNLATIAFLLISVADVLFLRRVGAVGLVNFLVFLQMTKIFSPKHDRDYMTIYVISFFELLITSIMTFSVLFALSCVIFAITATWALITLNMKRDIDAYILPDSSAATSVPVSQEAYMNVPALSSTLNRTFFAGTLGVTLVSFLLSLVIFVILPRFQEGMLFRSGETFSQRVSGFSEEVALDSFGTIRLDHRPVMRVILPDIANQQQLPHQLYWKGMTYNHYDGVRWRSETQRKTSIKLSKGYEQVAWLGTTHEKHRLLEQQIELTSADYEVIFAANTLQGTEGRFLSLAYDRLSGNAHVIHNPYSPNYTAYSDISRPADSSLQYTDTEYPETIRRSYLQVPELPERIRQLAREIGADLTQPYAMILAVQQYLMQHYEYSLDVQRSAELMPLDDFLFVNKAGHCEYYATSMAILLRILGVPTRLVNGFAQGRWNEYGRFFTVRQSDAHAWVEVYFPAYGWVTFDPTPPAAFGDTYQQFVEQRNFLANMYRYSEYLRTKWNRYVIDFSTRDQANLALRAFYASRAARRSLSSSLEHIRQQIQQVKFSLSSRTLWTILGAIPVVIFALYLLRRTLRVLHIPLPKFSRRSHSPRKQIIHFYKHMLHILARKGLSKSPAATPGEFARLVESKYPLIGSDVKYLTNLYYAVRYGHYQLQPEEISSVEAMLREMKKQQQKTLS